MINRKWKETVSIYDSPFTNELMHIAIDAHAVGTRLAGNETYIVNLIEALAETDTANRYTLYVTKREGVERFEGRWPHVEVRRIWPHTPIIRVPLALAAELRRRRVDLLHVQFTAPPFAPCPVVTTIHDLAFEHLPETFNRRSWMQLRLTVRYTARRAAHIIAPSEYTRRDIINTYGIAPTQITVTPEAAAPRFCQASEREVERVRNLYGIGGTYILAVGSIQPRKNLPRLIRAYAALRRERTEGNLPRLVLVGRRAWLYHETIRVARAEFGEEDFDKHVIFTDYVPDADLPALYSGALCFVYPSYFEGFGLPPLEAMACGTAVITGNLGSLPEVVGDAALLFDPFDETALAHALAQVIDDEKLRARLRAKGIERAHKFSWRETARLTLQAYRKAAKSDEMSDE